MPFTETKQPPDTRICAPTFSINHFTPTFLHILYDSISAVMAYLRRIRVMKGNVQVTTTYSRRIRVMKVMYNSRRIRIKAAVVSAAITGTYGIFSLTKDRALYLPTSAPLYLYTTQDSILLDRLGDRRAAAGFLTQSKEANDQPHQAPENTRSLYDAQIKIPKNDQDLYLLRAHHVVSEKHQSRRRLNQLVHSPTRIPG